MAAESGVADARLSVGKAVYTGRRWLGMWKCSHWQSHLEMGCKCVLRVTGVTQGQAGVLSRQGLG